ncbi:MAG: hypothetical protein NW208_01480 [Bryobacter sp.]|nr:hypothetical protein [Bryobacter sp.]
MVDRDLKSENFILREAGRVGLGDFATSSVLGGEEDRTNTKLLAG